MIVRFAYNRRRHLLVAARRLTMSTQRNVTRIDGSENRPRGPSAIFTGAW